MSDITPATCPHTDDIIYHIKASEKDIADNIIVVGDPERVPKIADQIFDKSKEIFHVTHRGLCTMTGYTKNGLRVSVVTHGIGTGSAEVVINELLILKMVDIKNLKVLREEPENYINIVRIGTSGALQEDTELGTAIVTKFAIGLDNTGLYYDIPCDCEDSKKLEEILVEKINENIDDGRRFKGKIHPYVSMTDATLRNALVEAAKETGLKYKVGMTVSAPGFFGCQGRKILPNVPLTINVIENVFKTIDFDGVKPENFEMEASLISFLTQPFKKVRGGCICMAIANRIKNTFAEDPEKTLKNCVDTVILAFQKLNSKNN